MDFSSLTSSLHAITSVLNIPVIIALFLAVFIVIYQFGSIVVEFFVERFKRKPEVTKVIEDISGKAPADKEKIIRANPFQIKQKKIFIRMLKNSAMPHEEQVLLATQLLSDEEARLTKRVVLIDIIVRLAPMLGLMGTLIPLGPGLIALGQGDTQALSDSLLAAFDTTIVGLATSGFAYVLSKIRKRWYQKDLMIVESILEGVIV